MFVGLNRKTFPLKKADNKRELQVFMPYRRHHKERDKNVHYFFSVLPYISDSVSLAEKYNCAFRHDKERADKCKRFFFFRALHKKENSLNRKSYFLWKQNLIQIIFGKQLQRVLLC